MVSTMTIFGITLNTMHTGEKIDFLMLRSKMLHLTTSLIYISLISTHDITPNTRFWIINNETVMKPK